MNRSSKLKISVVAIIFLFLFSASDSLAATPTITSLTPNSTQIPKYSKFEATFQINKTYPATSMLPYYYYDSADTPAAYPGRQSPYGVDGITIDARVTSPSGASFTVPAFYFQDYARTKSGSNAVMTAGTTYSWKFRFAPSETGNYSYYLTITDKDGTTRYPTTGQLNFNAVSSSNKGFVKVSPRDSRFLEYSNGESFIPIGSGHQWWKCCGPRSYDYDDTFSQYGQNGINFTRIWTQNDGFGLTVEGHFDQYKWPDDFNPEERIDLSTIPKGTQMNQRGGYELDKIIESAEANGVKLVVSAKEDPYWIWDEPRENYGSTPYMNYWKRNYRYRIARWGYSTSVLAWERWNEHGHIGSGTSLYNWYQQFAAYVRATDPFGHLITTSQGSQAYSPAYYASAAANYVSYHDYLMSGRYPLELYGDTSNFLYKAAQCLRNPKLSGCFMGDGSDWSGPQKPIFWGEFDSGTSNWNEPNPNPLVQHNGLWAGLFSTAGSSPLDWYWEQQNYISQKYADAKIASSFFSDIDYAGKNFVHIATSDISLSAPYISATNAKIRVMALVAANKNEAYAWAQHKDHTWKGVATPSAVSGSFTLTDINPGQYTLEYWNTTTGAKTNSTITVSSSRQAVVPINSLSQDTAIKIRNQAASAAPSSTPQPTACQKADINQDGIVDLSDYSQIAINFFKTNPSNPRADIDQDGIVDLSDYSLLAIQFLRTCN